jgi:hypothetical protein
MSTNNPTVTAQNIIDDVFIRLGEHSIQAASCLPWVSYAYQKLYLTIVSAGQAAKERYFGDTATFNLTPGDGDYTITDHIPLFGSFVKVELKYGKSGDDWVKASQIRSLSDWEIESNQTTQHRTKNNALYTQFGNTLRIIPVPPATETDQTPQAKVLYIKRPYQITALSDEIIIPYRFTFPIVNYVHARAIETENEDFSQAAQVELRFERELSQVAEFVDSEINENEGNFVSISTSSNLFGDPMRN